MINWIYVIDSSVCYRYRNWLWLKYLIRSSLLFWRWDVDTTKLLCYY